MWRRNRIPIFAVWFLTAMKKMKKRKEKKIYDI
jgi:hypothetical protein